MVVACLILLIYSVVIWHKFFWLLFKETRMQSFAYSTLLKDLVSYISHNHNEVPSDNVMNFADDA